MMMSPIKELHAPEWLNVLNALLREVGKISHDCYVHVVYRQSAQGRWIPIKLQKGDVAVDECDPAITNLDPTNAELEVSFTPNHSYEPRLERAWEFVSNLLWAVFGSPRLFRVQIRISDGRIDELTHVNEFRANPRNPWMQEDMVDPYRGVRLTAEALEDAMDDWYD